MSGRPCPGGARLESRMGDAPGGTALPGARAPPPGEQVQEPVSSRAKAPKEQGTLCLDVKGASVLLTIQHACRPRQPRSAPCVTGRGVVLSPLFKKPFAPWSWVGTLGSTGAGDSGAGSGLPARDSHTQPPGCSGHAGGPCCSQDAGPVRPRAQPHLHLRSERAKPRPPAARLPAPAALLAASRTRPVHSSCWSPWPIDDVQMAVTERRPHQDTVLGSGAGGSGREGLTGVEGKPAHMHPGTLTPGGHGVWEMGGAWWVLGSRGGTAHAWDVCRGDCVRAPGGRNRVLGRRGREGH